MNPFTRLQDVYLDTINLREELKQLPGKCDCKDADTHLSGRCSCAVPRFKIRRGAAKGTGEQR